MTGWLLDFLPWWTWYATVGALLLVTAPWWWPVASMAWALLPERARRIIISTFAIVGTVGGAYLAGRNRGSANERARAREAGIKAEQRREEKHNEIEALPDADLDRRLSRWMRDDK